MRTIVTLVVDHKKPFPAVADMAAQRTYTIDGVDNATVGLSDDDSQELCNQAVMEHLGPVALAHGTMSILQAFELGWKARGAL